MNATNEIEAARDLGRRVAARIMQRDAVWGNYCLDLSHEALLCLAQATGDDRYRDYVCGIYQQREWDTETVIRWESQPFCHVNYKLWEVTGEPGMVQPFVDESARYRKEVQRSPEGLVLHHTNSSPGANVLIDSMQDYTSRMAQTGKLTGDESYFRECVEQFRLYRQVLRDPKTGLWSTGRGWLEDPAQLSPGAWSRGHGWLIRGMGNSLTALPAGSEYQEQLKGYLRELADALLAVQDAEGMWHQLLHRPFEQSYPDTSGTGLICCHFQAAIREGFLPDRPYASAAQRALDALGHYVTAEGVVQQVCPGPGPLRSEENYLDSPGKDEDGAGHGPFAVLFACAERLK